MKKILTIILLTIIFQFCTSKKESESIDKILSFYGGKVEWSIGKNVSTDKEELQGSFFEVKLSDADLSHYDDLSFPASNIAYLFYSTITPEERSKYNFIRVIVEFNGTESKYEFPVEELEIVTSSMEVFKSTSNILKTGKFNLLKNRFLKGYDTEIDKFRKSCLEVDSVYGKVQDLVIQGYSLAPGKAGNKFTELLRMSGVLVREKQNTDFSVTIDSKDSDKKIVGIIFQQ
ncbi:hypothetical protein [Adhaeribacter rhizoryzae]|uniref:Uncharacterized protein n=1 Tax=Adhaeribacter rhizoryzae TaxID=2607907 RepID=A0A5M6DPA1_9BACT|nr:hypothetical protein [Adhaeribacter rhizoryzae]KAA5549308.1 hypothetical protein F0145_01560 [Adhaeribacter rhizoryzae]